MVAEDTRGQESRRGGKGPAPLCLLGSRARLSFSGWFLHPEGGWARGLGKGHGLKTEWSRSPPPRAPTPQPSRSPSPTHQPDKKRVAADGRSLAPGQLCSYPLGSLEVCGRQNGPPTIPLLISQPSLVSGCHLCSIMPPEPAVPPHLGGTPAAAWLLGRRHVQKAVLPGGAAGRSVGCPQNMSNPGSLFY